MIQPTFPGVSRRDVLKTSGQIAAAAAVSQLVLPKAYSGEQNTLQIALVGCGGRGGGAVMDAFSVKDQGPMKLVALADVFENNLQAKLRQISAQKHATVDVPPERQFVGFDAYKKAMDCLNPGDIVILATPPAFRWPHFMYAIEKGLNVFMEKPVTIDGPTSKKMVELAKQADAKNLKVGVGLMCRHCRARGELFDRIQDGEIGELLMLRAYRMHGRVGTAFVDPYQGDMPETLYQIKNFHGFLWASGGCYSDFYIHNIDECCWMKNDWPVEAKGVGGRHYRGDFVDQNFDNYAVEYTFKDGTKLFMDGRTMDGAYSDFASYAQGTKGSAIISNSGHAPSRARIYKGHKIDKTNANKADIVWQYGDREPNPYQTEWADLIEAIRNDRPYNEVERGVKVSLATSMGRMAAHIGQIVTWDDMENCTHEFAPGVAELTNDGPAPLQATENGKYPVPMPGLKKLEY